MPHPASGDPMPEPRAELDPGVIAIAAAIRDAGGRAIVVGGWCARPAPRDTLEGCGHRGVRPGGRTSRGRSRPVRRRSRNRPRVRRVSRRRPLDVDFSLPRRDSKRGPGHRGFDVVPDPSLEFDAAARRRDLTVNSIGLDPLTGEVLDPHGGCEDLAHRMLRATDPEHFPEDPLRGLRVVQLAARLEMEPDEALVALCRELDLSELSGERVFEEFRKLLLRAARPSLGFSVLEATDQLRFFPELDALRGVEQDPEWHPEGDVWVHTLMVLDAAASLRVGERVRRRRPGADAGRGVSRPRQAGDHGAESTDGSARIGTMSRASPRPAPCWPGCVRHPGSPTRSQPWSSTIWRPPCSSGTAPARRPTGASPASLPAPGPAWSCSCASRAPTTSGARRRMRSPAVSRPATRSLPRRESAPSTARHPATWCSAGT